MILRILRPLFPHPAWYSREYWRRYLRDHGPVVMPWDWKR